MAKALLFAETLWNTCKRFLTHAHEGFVGGGLRELKENFSQENRTTFHRKISFDSLAEMFCAYSQNVAALEKLIYPF